MSNSCCDNADPVEVLQSLTLEEIEARLAEIEGERAQLMLLRRSFKARQVVAERATRRNNAARGRANA